MQKTQYKKMSKMIQKVVVHWALRLFEALIQFKTFLSHSVRVKLNMYN